MPHTHNRRIPEDWPLLGFRLLVALLVGVHGWYRLLENGNPDFGAWLQSQHIPLPYVVAWAVTLSEIAGSTCLALGLCVRPFAALLMLIYVCGVALIHAAEGWFVVGAGRNGMEFSLLLIGSLLLVALWIRQPLWHPIQSR